MKNIKINFFCIGIVWIILLFPFLVQADSNLNCNHTLAYNSVGAQVKILQQSLNQAMGCDLVIDGIFGSNTYQCVIDFQNKYHLDKDGIVGKNTCNQLNRIPNNKSVSHVENNYIIVTATKLNVRKGASKKSTILTTVAMGDVFEVYDSKKINDTTWYKIALMNHSTSQSYGYVNGNYVKKDAIILNIKKQNLKLYKSGVKTLDTSVITGLKGKHDTPTGHYQINVQNKQTARTLRGTNDDGSRYRAYVDYWMPFITDRGIGFHDASWRAIDDYTTETYLSNGSHGCVNMQKEDAKILYESIDKTIDVLVIDA